MINWEVQEGYIPTFRIKQLAKNYVDDLGRGKITIRVVVKLQALQEL